MNLPTTLLSGITPKEGDRLTYDAETLANGPDAPEYRVLRADRLSWGYRWRLVIRDPILVHGLYDRISIRRPTLVAGQTTGWTYLHQNIPASVTLRRRAAGADAGNATLGETYRIAIVEDLADLLRQDQVVLADGKLLEIVAVDTPESLTDLTVLTCEPEIASEADTGI